jgi:hypothetical protein
MRARSRWLALLVAGPLSALLAASCTDDRGSIGDDCLKDEDCASGVCAELVCAAGPTYLDAAPAVADAEEMIDAAATSEAGARDAASDSALDATLGTPPEAGVSGDGSGGPNTDAGAESGPGASAESGPVTGTEGGSGNGAESGSEAAAGSSPDAEAGMGGDDGGGAASPADASVDVAAQTHLDGAGE